MNIEIRREEPVDAKRIDNLIGLAFRDAPHTDHREPLIVKALRESNALSISLVAEVQGEIVGHIAISPVTVSDGATDWYGLGPISVLPEYQRKGVGSTLMERAIEEMELNGAAGCVVLGEPDYYGRLGFSPVDGLVLPGVPPAYFQARIFRGGFAHGEVAYHEAFQVKDS